MSGQPRQVVLVTGAAGVIGSKLMLALQDDYEVVGLDLECGDLDNCLPVDLTSDDSVRQAVETVKGRYGEQVASVVHLAAYFDFSGEPSPMYDAVNVEGTRRLLRALDVLDVSQFVFSSTMLVHAPTEPGLPISEQSPLDARWPYPQSKLATERVIDETQVDFSRIFLRIAGVYTDDCGLPSLSHQIQRIYERRMQSHLFSGNPAHGQSFVHCDDVVDALARTVRNRDALEDGTRILIGESRVLSYEALQNRIGKLIHGENWRTRRIPKPVARLGAWVQEKSEPVVPDAIDAGEKPFIRPFMIPLADDHYEIDTSRAAELLGWSATHSLYEELPAIIDRLKSNPEAFYRSNDLNLPDWMRSAREEDIPAEALRKEHERFRRSSHRQFLWAHFLTIGLGAWLVTSPATLGYQSQQLALSDWLCGSMVMVLGFVSLSWRHGWARLVNAAIGVYLLFAPLIFWTPTSAAYLNGTLVGALVIGFAMLTRPAVGTAAAAELSGPDIPPGWDYSPSSWSQRLPIIVLAFLGLYISRYLAAYQLGHTPQAWDPFFGTGTERIISSRISEAWPVSDAGVGAVTYMLEILTGVVGGRDRWRTMPWLVILFGIMIVPLGAVSIFFIIIQPIVIGTWCSLCLLAAAAMLLQIPYSLDELLATGQFMAARRRKGRSLLKVFLHGDTMEEGAETPPEDFERSPGRILAEVLGGGVNLPWNLVLSAAIGVWLMCTRLTMGTSSPMADADHLLGALAVTISVAALAEMARPLRFLNVLIGACLLATPWMFAGGSTGAALGSVLAGIALIALSIPRGNISHAYGGWNRYLV